MRDHAGVTGRATEYDYVIVGAGSAGCVLANRLSADPDVRVVVLEAGPPDRDLFIHIPAGVYRVWKDPRINWNYESEAEGSMANRRIPVPRGRVVGGSSSINSMVYMRGHPLDYDRWAAEPGLATWDYAHCLPYFKRSEGYDRGGDAWRGGDGPLGVSRGTVANPLFDAWCAAGAEAGVGASDDLNGYRPEGLARLDSTKRGGRRCSAAVAYLRPALARPNLRLETGALVERVVTDGNRATGVDYVAKGGARRRVHAAREVILSGGAINSPQLLMLSGIGPADELGQHGIVPVLDLPGVGANLQDHVDIIVQYACPKPVTFAGVDKPLRKLATGLQWLASRSGLAASNIWEAGGLVRSNGDVPYPNLQYHFAPVAVDYEGERIVLKQGFQAHISQLRQESRGRVTLRSADPVDKARITFNFLSTERDRREFVEGVALTREIVATKPFDEFRGAELMPGPDVRSGADIEAFVSENAETEFHPSCTCRMGTGPDAVVDGELRVHGIEALRVVDASVMPYVISANLNAPTMMIAERAADFILGRDQLQPERPPFHFREESAAA